MATKTKTTENVEPETTQPVGRVMDLYGFDNNCFKLDDAVWEAVEDECDGYRSSLDSLKRVRDENRLSKLVFPGLPIAKVIVKKGEYSRNFYGWVFTDVDDGYEWARVGTDNADDWYPCFVCTFNPRPPVDSKEEDFDLFIQ